MSAETRLAEKLSELGLDMPPAPEPKGLYRPLVVVGDMAYTSGHLPVDAAGRLVTGRVGDDVDIPTATHAALLTGLSILATLRGELGSLDRIRRLVKLLGAVNGTAEFTEQPAVINGCSQLLADIFGPDAGIAARSAIGVASLPLGVPVEIEAVFQVEV